MQRVQMIANAVNVGAATMLSRIFGLLRDILIAIFLGASPAADAFFIAFRLPNLFRRLFAEGALNSAFVPILSSFIAREDHKGGQRFICAIAGWLLLALTIMTLLAEIFMPVLVRLIAPGYGSDPEKFSLAVDLCRLTFPYLAFIAFAAFLSGILNSLQRFFIAALAPVLLNLTLIGAMLICYGLGIFSAKSITVMLALAISISGLAQLCLLFWAVSKTQIRIFPINLAFSPPVRQMLTRYFPALIAGGITQINIVAGTIIASSLPGAVSYLYYADRIYQLPLGLIGIAIGVVLLPDLTGKLARGQEGPASETQNDAIVFAMALTLPAAAALLIISEPIISSLFEYGAFDANDRKASANALASYAWGLPAFVLIKIFSQAYFARADTTTPMWIGLLAALANIGLALYLAGLMAHVGIALAASIAAWINLLLLVGLLYFRHAFLPNRKMLRQLIAQIIASIIMVFFLYLAGDGIAGFFGGFNGSNGAGARIGGCVVLVIFGMGVYGIAGQLLGGYDLPSLFHRWRKK